MQRCCEASGVPFIRIHDLRHSHVSLLIELGFTVQLIAERIGDTVQMVLSTYEHLYPNRHQEVSDKLNDLIVSKKGFPYWEPYIFMLDYDYSIIVATLPEPTVLPPSRYQTGVLRCANGGFPCDSWGKIRIFHCVRVVFGDFVIMVLSRCLCIYLHICIYTI